MLKKIKTYIVGAYCLLAGFLFLAVIIHIALLLSFFVPKEKIDPFLKRAFRLMLRALFVRVEVSGLEKLSAGKSYIFMPNHVSFFDPFVLQAYLPNLIRGIEIESHFRWPIYGYFIKRFGNIPINQKSLRASLESMKQAGEYLQSGKSIVVFPEGSRTESGRLEKFKRMPFLLARETGKDIVPIGMSGLYRLMPRGSLLIRPGKVTLRIGEVIRGSKAKDVDSRELLALTRQQIEQLVS